jgi:hypothetical protein
MDFDKAIGRACTIKQTVRDNEIRHYNGILTAMRRLGQVGRSLPLQSRAAPVAERELGSTSVIPASLRRRRQQACGRRPLKVSEEEKHGLEHGLGRRRCTSVYSR